MSKLRTFAKVSIASTLITVFCFAKSGYAEVIDVINATDPNTGDPVYFDNGVLSSPDEDDSGHPIIAVNDFDNDVIAFEKSDEDETITINSFSGSPFILQGNVYFFNPVTINGLQTLDVNGSLVNRPFSDDLTDLRNVYLRINNYEISEDNVQIGHLILLKSINLGQADVADGGIIEVSSTNPIYINAYGHLNLIGNNTLKGDVPIHIEGLDPAAYVETNGLTVDADISVSAKFVNNSGTLTLNGDSVFNVMSNNNHAEVVANSGITFTGTLTNADNSSFVANSGATFQEVYNQNNAVMTTNSSAEFQQDVYNKDYAVLTTNSGASFQNVYNQGNAVLTANSGVSFQKVYNQGNATLTTNDVADFNDVLSNSGTSKVILNDKTNFVAIDNGDYATITANDEVYFNGLITTGGNSQIITKSTAEFNNQIENGGHAQIITKGVTTFNSTNNSVVNNASNAVITTNGAVSFDTVVNNTDSATLNLNGTTSSFAKAVNNSGNAVINVNSNTVFNNNFSNSDVAFLNINKNTTFNSNVTNTSNGVNTFATININANTLFNNVTLYNTGRAKINVNAPTSFYTVLNSGTIAVNNNANFSSAFINNGGTLTSTAYSVFRNSVTNINGIMNMSGYTDFEQGVDNTGTMDFGNVVNFQSSVVNNGSVISRLQTNIADTFDNNEVASLSNVNFNTNGASITNTGTLTLSDSYLDGRISNTIDGTLNLNNVTLNEDWTSLGALSVVQGGSLKLNNSVITSPGNQIFNFNNGSKLEFNVTELQEEGGKIIGNVKLNGDVSLHPLFSYGLRDGRYTFVDGSVDTDSGIWTDYSNSLYKVELDSDNVSFTYTKKTSGEMAEDLEINDNQSDTLEAIMSATSDNAAFNNVADNISLMLQSDDANQKQKALGMIDSITPEIAPVVQQVASDTSNQIFDVVGARLANRPMASSYRSRYRGIASGDNVFEKGAAWVQGMGSKSEFKGDGKFSDFETSTAGVAMGFEKQANDNIRLGVGYAYTQTEIDADIRNTDVNTHSAIFYSEYKHPRFFMNVIANYGWSNYNETNLAATADYVVESTGMQAMIGYYGLDTGVVRVLPEIGARYIHTKQHDYTNSIGAQYDNISADLFTGIVGARITAIGGNSSGLKIIPEAKIAFTYDIDNSEDNEAMVTLPNGASYSVKGRGLSRFGVEVGAGITAEVTDKVDLSVSYEGRFRKDFTDHTGLVKGQYKF